MSVLGRAWESRLGRSSRVMEGHGAERRTIEEYAMKRAIEFYSECGWHVRDVSARESYDLCAPFWYTRGPHLYMPGLGNFAHEAKSWNRGCTVPHPTWARVGWCGTNTTGLSGCDKQASAGVHGVCAGGGESPPLSSTPDDDGSAAIRASNTAATIR